jgi:hypothetical protein
MASVAQFRQRRDISLATLRHLQTLAIELAGV